MLGALTVWGARAPRALADVAYLVYVVILTAFIVLGPGVRALWLLATGDAGQAVLSDATVPATWAGATVVAWLLALVAGLERGPALRPPFVVATLGDADAPRLVSLGGPLGRGAALMVVAGAAIPLLPGLALVDAGESQPADVGLLALAGAVAGLIAAVAWLSGQVLRPGAVGALVVGLGTLAVLATATGTWHVAPWALLGAAWPGGGGLGALALAGAGAAVAALVPALRGLERLETRRLVGQAVRAQRAQTLVSAMDLQAAGEIYRARPTVARRVRAVRRVPGPAAVVVADAVGSLRAPWRLAAGLASLVAAGAVVGAVVPGTSLAVGPTATAILGYLGVSALCDGVRHAAALGRANGQYGYPLSALLTLHVLWPFGVAAGAAAAGAAVAGAPVGLAVAVLAIAVAVRVADALKGPMPVELLVPVITPAGDVSALGRLVWLADAPILVLATGVAGGLAAAGRGGLGIVAGIVLTMLAWRASRR